MNKMNILVIEDSKEISDKLVALLEANQYNVVAVAATHKDALAAMYASHVDLIIIDVFLGDQPDGILFAETISTIPEALKPFIFLTSSHDRRIFERAKLTRPFGFLLKPFNELEVLYAIEMALEKFYDQSMALTGETKNVVFGDDYLFIKKNRALKKVRIAEILYIDVDKRYCNIHTENERFVVQLSLVKAAEMFEAYQFVRTHRNYLVNSKWIEEIIPQEDAIILSGKREVPLSENYKKIIKNLNLLR